MSELTSRPRLLAYGGSSFEYCARLGDWARVEEGALGDGTTIPGGRREYGCGLIGSRPTLILRERQNPHLRGGYPFSLLLDPGDRTWEAVGWNPARLLFLLFDHDEKPGAPLLLTVQHVSQPALDLLIERAASLAAPGRGPASAAARAFADGVAGSSLATAARLGALDLLGFEDRPQPVDLIQAIDLLPVCLRTCHGWLVGSGLAHAGAFGARLALADSADESAIDGDLAARGQVVRAAVESASRRMPSSETIGALSQPFFRWERRPDQVLSDLVLLSQILRGDPLDEGLLGRVNSKLGEPGDVASAIASAAEERLLQERGPLGPTASKLVLGRCLDLGTVLPAGQVAKLDPETVVAELAARHLKPNAVPHLPDLEAGLRSQVWSRLVDDSAIEKLPDLVVDAKADLAEEAHWLPLLVRALSRSERSHLPLSIWRTLGKDDALAQQAEPHLQGIARARAMSQTAASWPVDYLEFANDPGGCELSRTSISAAEVLVRAIHQTADENLLGTAKAWLVALATSPLRASFSLGLKTEVASSGGSAWKNFRALGSLVHGRTPTGTTEPPSEPERDYLLGELRALLHGVPPGGTPPLVDKIMDWLGPLPSDVITIITGQRVSVRGPRGRAWLEALDRIAGKGQGTRGVLSALSGENPELTFADLGALRQRGVIRALLREDEKDLPKGHASLLATLGAAFPGMVAAIAVEESGSPLVLRRVCAVPGLLERALTDADSLSRRRLLASLATNVPDAFRRLVLPTLINLKSGTTGSRLRPFERQIVDFLAGPDGRQLANLLGTPVFGQDTRDVLRLIRENARTDKEEK